MTKSTMITTIQEKEADLWENLEVVERVFGKDSIQAKYKRAAWNSVWGSNERHGYKDIRQGCPMSKERRLTMEYQVLAIKWLLEKGAQVEYIAGEFPDYVNAKIFAEAYTNHFYTKATIVKKGA